MSDTPASLLGRRRVEAVDVVRGFAIVLVVIGHSIQWTDAAFDTNLVFRLIYSFHMPLFFFISGVVGARGVRRPLALQVRARARGLLLPFFSWWLVVSVWQLVAHQQSLRTAALSLYRSPDTGLWFLWVLFVVGIIGALTVRAVPRRWAWAALLAVALLLWSIRLPVLGLGLVSTYFPYFSAGLLLSERFLEGDALSRRRLVLGTAAVLAWLLLALAWQRPGLTLPAQAWARAGYPLARVVDIAYRYATAAAGISATALMAAFVPTASRLGRSLAFVGRNTLEVYVSHEILLAPFTGVGLAWAPVAAALVLAGSLAIARVLKRVAPLRLLLYGGRG